MLVIRSDKYHVPAFNDNDKLSIVEKKANPLVSTIEVLKYVDVDTDAVFIFDGKKQTITPTYGTVRKLGEQKSAELVLEFRALSTQDSTSPSSSGSAASVLAANM